MLAGLLLMMALVSGMTTASLTYMGAYYKQKKVDETVRHWQVMGEVASAGLTLFLVYLFILQVVKKGGLCTLG